MPIEMPFMDHVRSLRKSLIVSCFGLILGISVAFGIYDRAIQFIMTPFMQLSLTQNIPLNIHSLYEGFLVKFKLSFLIGFVISFPIHIFSVTRFVFPALKKREKWGLFFILIISSLLFGFSFYLSYFHIIPYTVTFLMSKGFIPENVMIALNFQTNVGYIIQFIFYALTLFQFPVVLEVLLAMNVINRRDLLRSSRYVVVGIFALSALITPPDIISQIGLSLPLISLYFLTLFVAWIMGWGEG